jgi:hypothetical protein
MKKNLCLDMEQFTANVIIDSLSAAAQFSSYSLTTTLADTLVFVMGSLVCAAFSLMLLKKGW